MNRSVDWPGAGLVVALLSCLLGALFAAYALTPPRLDRVWRSESALRVGWGSPLSSRELSRFQASLCEHPGLAESLLEGKPARIVSANRSGVTETGYAYFVLSKEAERLGVRVEAPGRELEKPKRVRLRWADRREELLVTRDKPATWVPPRERPCATIVELLGSLRSPQKARSKGDQKGKRPTALRLSFVEGP